MSAQSSTGPLAEAKAALGQFLQAGVASWANKASKKVDEVTGKLEDTAAEGGPALTAGLSGLAASDEGKSPVWAAAKGAWSGLSTKAKVLIVVIVVLVLLLAPVVLVLLLLALLVAGAVKGVRAATG